MAKKPENLFVVLQSMHEYALEAGISLPALPMTVYIWVDTDKDTCKAITGKLFVYYAGTVDEFKLFMMLQLINKVTPIYKITIKGHPSKTFLVSDTEAYMKKGCDSC
jgi:hypothetical protein